MRYCLEGTFIMSRNFLNMIFWPLKGIITFIEHEILFNFLPIWVQDTTKGFTNKVYDGTTEPEIYRDNSISYYHKALNKTSGRVQIMTKMSSKVRLV